MGSEIVATVEMDDMLKSIDNYKDELLISQVIIFFERHNVEFTKTMIQNYVKKGLIPPPAGKRRSYSKEHLLLLALINNLKEIYSLSEIKIIFESLDGILDAQELYKLFMVLHSEAIEAFGCLWSGFENEKMQHIIKAANLENIDKSKATAMISLLVLPTYSKIIKNIIRALWDTI